MSLLTLFRGNLDVPTVKPAHAMTARPRVRDFKATARVRDFTASSHTRDGS